MRKKIKYSLLTITEGGMIFYWCFATLAALKIIHVAPEFMYSDYNNPLIVSWNWSFFPLDVLFAIIGLLGRFASFQQEKKEMLSVISLSLMFCAGLMAISFWVIRGNYDPFWWVINLWLIVLSAWILSNKLFKSNS